MGILLYHFLNNVKWRDVAETASFVCNSVRSSMVQYAAVLQRLFSQTLSAWTPAPEASLGQQRAYR